MGELIPLSATIDGDEDILTDVYMRLNDAADDTGYLEDRIGWLRRMERVLSPAVHRDYIEFTEEMWTPEGRRQ